MPGSVFDLAETSVTSPRKTCILIVKNNISTGSKYSKDIWFNSGKKKSFMWSGFLKCLSVLHVGTLSDHIVLNFCRKAWWLVNPVNICSDLRFFFRNFDPTNVYLHSEHTWFSGRPKQCTNWILFFSCTSQNQSSWCVKPVGPFSIDFFCCWKGSSVSIQNSLSRPAPMT